MGIYEELEWRGLIKDVSDPSLKEKLNKGGMTFYIGTDPTGDSLHIGHFSSFLICKRLKDAGHHPIVLIGGATGLIGDPRPESERPMIQIETVEHNFNCLKNQLTSLFDCEVVNNYDWSKDISFIDFLRDFGKFFNVNYMLNKDIVARRLDEGITYTEFSYMIMQALDFWWLNKNKNVTMQVAGQDQWGNMTSGIELIRKKEQKEVYAFTMPLLTKSDGTKFGKTNGKSVWLDANKTTPYEMYQFFINVEDTKVIDYLKFLTFLTKEEIEELEKKHLEAPHLREAHTALAREVITYLHGKDAYEQALKISKALFSGNIKELTAKEIAMGFNELPAIEGREISIVDALLELKLASSKREAREFIRNGAVSVNGDKVTEEGFILSKTTAIEEKFIVVRRGKKLYALLKY
ncbi:MAG: tyrosine--tRNA ligase [Acholeplasmatales bacterium]|jgi:tyrosyl-tRNA synthetase|nr:tyrosine--tRNA ligase [Acholeplasmatales bacterium]